MIALALVIGMIMTGMLSHARSHLVLRGGGSARPARSGGHVAGSTDGISTRVGPIPGAASQGAARPAGRWQYAASHAQTTSAIAAKPLSHIRHAVPKVHRLLPSDVLVVAPSQLPAGLVARIRKMTGVIGAVPVDAGRIQVNGVFVNVLGVSPGAFRPYAPKPTARSAMLWQNIAAGGMAISYTMGSQDRLTLAKPVTVTAAKTLKLPVAGFGTVGIGGVDAVVSDTVASSLGLPAGNAIVISAPNARLDQLIAKIKKAAPAGASVTALVTQVIVAGTAVTTGAAGATGATAGQGPGLSATEVARFLAAARSRLGRPYVWGGSGPSVFDCSGLVQWSMAQAGIVMPRVAADQALSGPLVPLSQLAPGDLLFYHTDPTAPNYISHVAIYLGNGLMEQAPEPGLDVEIVPADFGAGFAGAVRVYPKVAAQVAAGITG